MALAGIASWWIYERSPEVREERKKVREERKARQRKCGQPLPSTFREKMAAFMVLLRPRRSRRSSLALLSTNLRDEHGAAGGAGENDNENDNDAAIDDDDDDMSCLTDDSAATQSAFAINRPTVSTPPSTTMLTKEGGYVWPSKQRNQQQPRHPRRDMGGTGYSSMPTVCSPEQHCMRGGGAPEYLAAAGRSSAVAMGAAAAYLESARRARAAELYELASAAVKGNKAAQTKIKRIAAAQECRRRDLTTSEHDLGQANFKEPGRPADQYLEIYLEKVYDAKFGLLRETPAGWNHNGEAPPPLPRFSTSSLSPQVLSTKQPRISSLSSSPASLVSRRRRAEQNLFAVMGLQDKRTNSSSSVFSKSSSSPMKHGSASRSISASSVVRSSSSHDPPPSMGSPTTVSQWDGEWERMFSAHWRNAKEDMTQPSKGTPSSSSLSSSLSSSWVTRG